jgi:flagellar M-ring protein FliF
MASMMANESSIKQPGIRQFILIGGAALAGAVVLFALWYLFLRIPYVSAFSGLKSSDAATIVGELDRLKTPYRLADDGATILVPSDTVDATRVNILGGDLPLKGAVGFELFNKTDMGLSEFAQKINYQRALQGELARTIMALEEIDTARVHLSLPESGIFQRDRQVAKASITISTKVGMAVDSDVVDGIQQLVASAVPDLQATNVAILDARGRMLSAVASTSLLQSSNDERRNALEHMYADKVRAAIGAAGLTMPMTVDVMSFDSLVSTGVDSASTASDATPDQALPRSRKTPFKVTIALGVEPGAQVRERMLVAARQAVGFDPSLGDIVVISVDPTHSMSAKTSLSLRPLPAAMPSKSLDNPAPARSFFPVAIGASIVLLVSLGWWFWRKRALWAQVDTEAFSARLKTLLEEDARNASASV